MQKKNHISMNVSPELLIIDHKEWLSRPMQQHGFHLIYQTLKHRRAPNLMTVQSEYYLAAICYATKSVSYLHKKILPPIEIWFPNIHR